MLQKGKIDIAKDRNNQDYLSLSLCVDISSLTNVLDIGCGYGRWLENLLPSIKKYDGFDGAEHIIAYAQKTYKSFYPNIQFHKCILDNLALSMLRPYYDLVIFNGILMYCNDNTLKHILKTLQNVVKFKTIIYLRESLSVIKDTTGISSNNQRLTLKECKTEASHLKYNAIYRTIDEYETVFKEFFPQLAILNSGFINTETCVYKETNQHYWVIQL